MHRFGPAAAVTRRRAASAETDEDADLNRAALQVADDLGLLCRDGCVTDQGLLELTVRLRCCHS